MHLRRERLGVVEAGWRGVLLSPSSGVWEEEEGGACVFCVEA